MNPASHQSDMKAGYKANSITLGGAVAMGTGVMIGAGIFDITDGPLVPILTVGVINFAFLVNIAGNPPVPGKLTAGFMRRL